jgi:hypothetical protein
MRGEMMPTTRELIEQLRPQPAELSIRRVVNAARKAGRDPTVGRRHGGIRNIVLFRGGVDSGSVPIGLDDKVRVVFVEEFDGTKLHFEPRFIDWSGRVMGRGRYGCESEKQTELSKTLGFQPTEEFEVGPTLEVYAPCTIDVTLVQSRLADDLPTLLEEAIRRLAAIFEKKTGFGVKHSLSVRVRPPD